MKEWKLIDEIIVSENDEKYEIENLDLEEILVEAIGLINISETSSEISIRINNLGVTRLDTQKATGASDVAYQKTHSKFNGLFWETTLTQRCNNEEGYYVIFSNLLSNYSVKKDVGRCEKISIVTHTKNYALKSGTIRVYGR